MTPRPGGFWGGRSGGSGGSRGVKKGETLLKACVPVLILWLAWPGTPAVLGAGAPPRAAWKAEGLSVESPPEAEKEARLVLETMPAILDEITRALRAEAPPAMSVDLLSSRAFVQTVGERRGEWALAVAFPSRAHIAINLGRLDARNDLYTTLKHETVHLVLGRVEAEAGRRLPLWFHEGVAQWMCEKLFVEDRGDFLAAAHAGTLFPLDELERAFPLDGRDVNIAYAQSEDFISRLEKKKPGAVGGIVARFRRGLPFEDAFREAVGEDRAAWEKRWRARLRSGTSFLVQWLQSSPGALLLLLLAFGGVLTFLGYLRYRLRRRDLMRQWDAEEAFEEDGVP